MNFSTAGFRRLFEHNRKFINPVADSLLTVNWERLCNDKICGLGSLRELVVHTFRAEDFWLTKVMEGKQLETYKGIDFQDVPSLARKWEAVIDRSLFRIDSFTAEDLTESRTYNWGDGDHTFRVDDILLHVYTHTVHHRGQMIMGVRQLGGHPKEVDIL